MSQSLQPITVKQNKQITGIMALHLASWLCTSNLSWLSCYRVNTKATSISVLLLRPEQNNCNGNTNVNSKVDLPTSTFQPHLSLPEFGHYHAIL